jgi:hypothetical protein
LTFTAGLLELAALVSALTVAVALRPPLDVVLGFAETFSVAPAGSAAPPGVCGPNNAPDVSAPALTVMPLLLAGLPTTALAPFVPLGIVAVAPTCSDGTSGSVVEGRFVPESVASGSVNATMPMPGMKLPGMLGADTDGSPGTFGLATAGAEVLGRPGTLGTATSCGVSSIAFGSGRATACELTLVC